MDGGAESEETRDQEGGPAQKPSLSDSFRARCDRWRKNVRINPTAVTPHKDKGPGRLLPGLRIVLVRRRQTNAPDTANFSRHSLPKDYREAKRLPRAVAMERLARAPTSFAIHRLSLAGCNLFHSLFEAASERAAVVPLFDFWIDAFTPIGGNTNGSGYCEVV